MLLLTSSSHLSSEPLSQPSFVQLHPPYIYGMTGAPSSTQSAKYVHHVVPAFSLLLFKNIFKDLFSPPSWVALAFVI